MWRTKLFHSKESTNSLISIQLSFLQIGISLVDYERKDIVENSVIEPKIETK